MLDEYNTVIINHYMNCNKKCSPRHTVNNKMSYNIIFSCVITYYIQITR